MLLTAHRHELQQVIDEIIGSVAIVEPNAHSGFLLLAANPPFFAMLGQPYQTPQANSTLYDYVPSYALGTLTKALQDTLEEQRPGDFRQAFEHHGQTSWWRILVKPLRAFVGGQPKTRLMISATDITEKIFLAEQRRTEQLRYQGLFDTAYDAVLTVDLKHQIKLSNPAAQNAFGYTREELHGMALNNLLPRRFREHHGRYVQQFAHSPINSRHMFERGEVICLRKDASEFPAEISISKIRVNDEIEFTAVIRDISERNTLMRELELRATTDPLTGIRNRRYALEIGHVLLAGHRRNERPLCALMLDLDHFKDINDQYGHPVGDTVLQAVANLLTQEIRKGDVLARFGGEEFLLLLAETDLAQAVTMAERVREQFSRISAEISAQQALPLTITCSIGISSIDPNENSLDPAIARADQALYRAKAAGRNCVISHTDAL